MMSNGLPNSYTISDEQRKFYEENGYLVIKGLLDFDTVNNYKQRFIQICEGTVSIGSLCFVNEVALLKQGVKREDSVNKIREIHCDDVFMTYTEHPRLLNVLSQFIGADMRVMNSLLINKPPGSVGHPPHQDLFYFPFRPAEKIIAAWTAIDDVTVENGCLYVIPKSHKRDIVYAHGQMPGATKLYHGILDPVVSKEPRVNLEMSPGDTVFFHPLLVHGSGPNTTNRYRKCITAHYASSHCHYIDPKGTLQETLAEELTSAAKKHGVDISFSEIFRYKSKAVTRVQSKL